MKYPKELELMTIELQKRFVRETELSDHDSKEVKASIVHARADLGYILGASNFSYMTLKQIRNALWIIIVLLIYAIFFR